MDDDRSRHSHTPPPPPSSSSETVMAALLTVPPTHLPALTRSLAADAHHLRSRLAFLLLSPPHFSRALSRLRSMPLPAKAALLGRSLLRSLLLLLPSLSPGGGHHLILQPSDLDLDAAILLQAMCDSYSPAAAAAAGASSPVVDWRAVIVDDVVATALSVSGLAAGATPCWAVVAPYVDAAAKCRRFADLAAVAVAGGTTAAKDGGGWSGGAAWYAAVEAGDGDGEPCAICREEMVVALAARGGGGVCALRPCGHEFHRRCAMRWLARRNTCPCCRAELPADDPLAETRRLWRGVERMARGG